ncbi:MAG: hypothetical protein ACLR92_02740 [Bacilli bacterium]
MEKAKLLYNKIKLLEKSILQNFINDGSFAHKDFCHFPKPTPTQMQIMQYLLDHINENVYQRDLEDVLDLKRAKALYYKQWKKIILLKELSMIKILELKK